MKKDFLDELLEALQELKAERDASTIDAPVAPDKVIKTVIRVAGSHKLTLSEKTAFAAAASALDGITLEEAQTLRNLEEQARDSSC